MERLTDKRVIYAEDLLAVLRDDPHINGTNFARVKRHVNEMPGVDDVEMVRCKEWIPGQEIYVVERDEDGAACEVTGYMLLAEVAGAAILTPYINDLETLEEALDYHIEETADNYDTDLVVFPVDDCYADRDAAERALEAEQGSRP